MIEMLELTGPNWQKFNSNIVLRAGFRLQLQKTHLAALVFRVLDPYHVFVTKCFSPKIHEQKSATKSTLLEDRGGKM